MGPIQSSINTALGVAALASGLTNKKQVEKALTILNKYTDDTIWSKKVGAVGYY